MKTHIIGITGKKGKGKTSFTHVLIYLLSINGFSVKLVHFADYIKKIARECFQKDIKTIHGELSKEERELLCQIGDALRSIDENSLCNIVEKQLVESSQDFIIVGDVRLLREANLIRKYNGLLVRVESKVFRRHEEYLQEHKTEQEISDIEPDFIVQNEGTFSDLIQEGKKILSHSLPDYPWKS